MLPSPWPRLSLVAPPPRRAGQEYNYPDYAFSVAFPAKPQIETTNYQVADNRAVKARVYSVSQNNAMFKVTIAELGDTGLEEGALIDHAIKNLS
jgi:hypothetical protein